MLFRGHTVLMPASEHLYLPFPLLGTRFPQRFTWFAPLPHSAEMHLPQHLSTVAPHHPVTHLARVHFLKSTNHYVTFYYIMYLL